MINLLENTYNDARIYVDSNVIRVITHTDIMSLCKNYILYYKSMVSFNNVSFLLNHSVDIQKAIPCVYIGAQCCGEGRLLNESLRGACNYIHEVNKIHHNLIVQIYCINEVKVKGNTKIKVHFNIFQRT